MTPSLPPNQSTTANEVQDFQARLCAAQEVQERVDSTGQRLVIAPSGHLVLYHGTSDVNAKRIRESGKFFAWAFFAPSKSAVEPHARPKHGASTVVLQVLVDPRDVEFSTGSGEFFAPESLVMADGLWRSDEQPSSDLPSPGIDLNMERPRS